MDTPTGIGVFVKYPEEGKVKTRLAKDLGHSTAVRAYRWMTHTVLSLLQSLDKNHFQTTLFFEPTHNKTLFEREYGEYGFPLLEQRGNDLGARLSNASQALLQNHASMFLIGSDCVEITPSHFEESRRYLEQGDVVIGPAKDGGYYLIGMKKNHASLFQDIPWSTNEVCEKTVAQAKEAGLDLHLLDPLSDIDTKENLPTNWKELVLH